MILSYGTCVTMRGPYTVQVFAQKLRIEIEEGGAVKACPIAWMDQFFMRSFTGVSAMDETLPVADGLLEAGLRVDRTEVAAHFERWLRGRKMIAPDARLLVSGEASAIKSVIISG